MNTDLQYAINQLKPILEARMSEMTARDRVRRALDALERMAEAEMEATEFACTSTNRNSLGKVYHCNDLECPIHGPRNQGM